MGRLNAALNALKERGLFEVNAQGRKPEQNDPDEKELLPSRDSTPTDEHQLESSSSPAPAPEQTYPPTEFDVKDPVAVVQMEAEQDSPGYDILVVDALVEMTKKLNAANEGEVDVDQALHLPSLFDGEGATSESDHSDTEPIGPFPLGSIAEVPTEAEAGDEIQIPTQTNIEIDCDPATDHLDASQIAVDSKGVEPTSSPEPATPEVTVCVELTDDLFPGLPKPETVNAIDFKTGPESPSTDESEQTVRVEQEPPVEVSAPDDEFIHVDPAMLERPTPAEPLETAAKQPDLGSSWDVPPVIAEPEHTVVVEFDGHDDLAPPHDEPIQVIPAEPMSEWHAVQPSEQTVSFDEEAAESSDSTSEVVLHLTSGEDATFDRDFHESDESTETSVEARAEAPNADSLVQDTSDTHVGPILDDHDEESNLPEVVPLCDQPEPSVDLETEANDVSAVTAEAETTSSVEDDSALRHDPNEADHQTFINDSVADNGTTDQLAERDTDDRDALTSHGEPTVGDHSTVEEAPTSIDLVPSSSSVDPTADTDLFDPWLEAGFGSEETEHDDSRGDDEQLSFDTASEENDSAIDATDSAVPPEQDAPRTESNFQPVLGTWAQLPPEPSNQEPTSQELPNQELEPSTDVSDSHPSTDRSDAPLNEPMATEGIHDQRWTPRANHAGEETSPASSTHAERPETGEASDRSGTNTADSESRPLQRVAPTSYEVQIAERLLQTDFGVRIQQLSERVTSQLPNEGALAISLVGLQPDDVQPDAVAALGMYVCAQRDGPTLIVDVDEATQRMSRNFEVDEGGLFDVLSGVARWTEVVRPTSCDKLHLMPWAPTDSHLADPDFDVVEDLVGRWLLHYDLIIIDGGTVDSPVARAFCRAAHATFLCVPLGVSDRQQLLQSTRDLVNAGVNLRGCVTTGSTAPPS